MLDAVNLIHQGMAGGPRRPTPPRGLHGPRGAVPPRLVALGELAAYGFCPEAHRQLRGSLDAQAWTPVERGQAAERDADLDRGDPTWIRARALVHLVAVAAGLGVLVAWWDPPAWPRPAWSWGYLALAALALAGPVAASIRRLDDDPYARLGRPEYRADEAAGPPLRAYAEGVQGRPDALVRVRRFGVFPELRPVKIVTEAPPARPRASHALELAGAGLLAESRSGAYPSAGYFLYHVEGARFHVRRVHLGRRARAATVEALARIRQGSEALREPPADGRCAACALRRTCRLQAPPAPSRTPFLPYAPPGAF